MVTIVNRFRQMVDERGIKQKFICEKTGYAPSTISAIYKGKLPHIETALVIAKFFECKVEDIWSLKEE